LIKEIEDKLASLLQKPEIEIKQAEEYDDSALKVRIEELEKMIKLHDGKLRDIENRMLFLKQASGNGAGKEYYYILRLFCRFECYRRTY
jgi:hypothetical protein